MQKGRPQVRAVGHALLLGLALEDLGQHLRHQHVALHATAGQISGRAAPNGHCSHMYIGFHRVLAGIFGLNPAKAYKTVHTAK